MLRPDLHATFVPGEPARQSGLFMWPMPAGRNEMVLAVPEGEGVSAVATRGSLVTFSEVLDELVGIRPDAEASRSIRAWAHAARVVLELVGAGRLQPSVAAHGADCWTLAPLTQHDREVRANLAAWLPPEAHCLAVVEPTRLAIAAPDVTMADFYQAIADVLPRTAAAPAVSGQWAWADGPPSDVSALRPFLAGTDSVGRTVVGLRLALPEEEDDPFRVTVQVRSALEPSIVADAADLWAGRAAGFDHRTETDLLLALRRGSALWPPLAELLDEAQPSSLEIPDDQAMQLFGTLATDLVGAGIEVLIPAALTRSLQATAHAEPPPGVGDTPSTFDLTTACTLTWRATVDGEPVSDHELSALAQSRRPLVRMRGQWVVVDPVVVAKLKRRDQLSGSETLRAALGGAVTVDDEVIAVEVGGAAAQLADRLRDASTPRELAEPPGLDATLRPYQRRGVAWMSEMVDLGFGGVLADDMGLGKTIQLISLHLHRMASDRGGAPTLVVCPATVVGNWQHELARFAPGLTVHRYHGTERSLEGIGPDDVVVTTYGIVRRDHPALATARWGLVVADEAQMIKNPNAATARALRRIGSDARIAMTGTPVENRLTELWSLLDWTTPGLLGSVDAFRRNVAIPIERDRDAEATARFAGVIAPFLLRRRKDDPEVAPDLPPKTETTHPVTLSVEQAALYRAVIEEVLHSIERSEGFARHGLVFKLLNALKQVCNHPAQYLQQPGPIAARSGKLDAFDDLVTAIADAGDSTLVFTQYVAMGNLLMARLAELGIAAEFLHGSLSLTRRTEMVERFQRGEFKVFVISLKAGGTGLNLTRATHVIHYDRWWNPAVENQASDRAWRLGQTRAVQVHQLICEGTLEERIAMVLAEKQKLADSVVGSGEAWLAELNNDELAELVRLGGGD